MQWWHWLIIGFVLCLLELAIPAFVLIWLGVAALALGGVTAMLPMPLAAQLLVWAALSVLMVFGWMRVFGGRRSATRAGTSDSGIGEVGLLTCDVMPFQPGEVMFQRPFLGTDRWHCVSSQSLKAGSRVRVVKIEGNSVVVEAA